MPRNEFQVNYSYLFLTLFLPIVGGVISSYQLREKNRDFGDFLLVLGFLQVLVLVAGFFLANNFFNYVFLYGAFSLVLGFLAKKLFNNRYSLLFPYLLFGINPLFWMASILSRYTISRIYKTKYSDPVEKEITKVCVRVSLIPIGIFALLILFVFALAGA